jgi:O-antigen/teichoic acid export membrane protein
MSKDLLKLGGQFFIIQIAGLVQYQMINFLMLRYYGANDVTAYNVSYRYFSVLNMGWSILIAPLWVAVTDAVTNKEFSWIRNVEKKYTLLWLTSFVFGAIMLYASSFVYHIWVGDKVSIPFTLSFWILIYNLQFMFAYIFVSILNGAGILKVQMYSSLVSPLLFLGLCYYFISNNLGVHYIIIAAILSNFNGIILAPIQCYFKFRVKNTQTNLDEIK